jgi:opacity protein-like surface antigen
MTINGPVTALLAACAAAVMPPMRTILQRSTLAVFGILAVLLVPSVASAQAYLVPFIGGNFGGDSGTTLDQSISNTSRLAYGARLGAMAHGIVGADIDFGYTPHFYGQGSTFDSSGVLTVMGNLVVGLPAGPVRPYVTGGVGIIRRSIDFSSLENVASISDTKFAYDVGGGLNILFSKHIGINGDLRYFRNFASGMSFKDLVNDTFGLWRGSVGLVLQF